MVKHRGGHSPATGADDAKSPQSPAMLKVASQFAVLVLILAYGAVVRADIALVRQGESEVTENLSERLKWQFGQHLELPQRVARIFLRHVS